LNSKLKLIKKPESSSLIFRDFDKLDNALLFVNSIKDKEKPELSALEIINPQVSKTV
jgi:hypothetical protein